MVIKKFIMRAMDEADLTAWDVDKECGFRGGYTSNLINRLDPMKAEFGRIVALSKVLNIPELLNPDLLPDE